VIFFVLDMLTELPFSFPGKIFRSPMPFSLYGHDQVWQSFLEQKVDVVIVLAERQEFLVYARRDLLEFYRSQGLEVLHTPVPDFGIPEDLHLWKEMVAAAAEAGNAGKNVVVHCLAGIGRTGTFLACLAKQCLGLDGQGAINWVRETIPGALENYEQEQFVINFI
jgi:protein-tyrosine phosphatase